MDFRGLSLRLDFPVFTELIKLLLTRIEIYFMASR